MPQCAGPMPFQLYWIFSKGKDSLSSFCTFTLYLHKRTHWKGGGVAGGNIFRESVILDQVISKKCPGFGGERKLIPTGLLTPAHVSNTTCRAPRARAGSAPIPAPLSSSSSSFPGSLCSLSIKKALPEDRGLYRCMAKNGAGQAECSCQVTVDGRSCTRLCHTESRFSSPPSPTIPDRTACKAAPST